MNYDILRSGGIDVKDALNRFSGSRELFEKYIEKFIDESSYEELLEAMNNKEYTLAENAVHSLKGVSGSLGLTSLFTSSCALLAAFREKEEDSYKHLFHDVQDKYTEIIAVIKNSIDS